jgi:hypothetical protein
MMVEPGGEMRKIMLVRRTPAEAKAWLDALDEPDATGEDAERWRQLSREAQALVRELVIGR